MNKLFIGREKEQRLLKEYIDSGLICLLTERIGLSTFAK